MDEKPPDLEKLILCSFKNCVHHSGDKNCKYYSYKDILEIKGKLGLCIFCWKNKSYSHYYSSWRENCYRNKQCNEETKYLYFSPSEMNSNSIDGCPCYKDKTLIDWESKEMCINCWKFDECPKAPDPTSKEAFEKKECCEIEKLEKKDDYDFII